MAQLLTTAAFLAIIEAFCERHQIKPSNFGKMAAADSGFVNRLRKGRSPSLDKTTEVVRWMNKYDAEKGQPNADNGQVR